MSDRPPDEKKKSGEDKSRGQLEVVEDRLAPPDLLGAKVQTVLLLGHRHKTREKVLGALPNDYELVTAQAGESGLRAARICAPDVILFDTTHGDLKTLGELADDPLSRSIPVVVLRGEEDDDETQWPHNVVLDHVRQPINVVELRGLIVGIVEGDVYGDRLFRGDLGEASLAEIVEFIQRELEHWVLEAAGPGAQKVRVKLGDSGDLMGAFWAFVARFRDLVKRGSGGVVTFRALEEGRISMLSLSASTQPEMLDETDIVAEQASAETIKLLTGLRAVVADDDDEIRSLFTSVLSEVGMDVEAVRNGREALLAVRRKRPDVVITDIVMPVMDGWELLKHLRHDVLVRDIPIVVLSWKEDFLQRMKELDADADAYMKKEMDRNQILLRISDVLSSRLQIESRLANEKTMVGRVEAVGIVPLLRALLRQSSDQTLIVREAWNLFSVSYANGKIANVEITTTGGRSFSGMDALRVLIGVRRGRFTIKPTGKGEAKTVFDDDLATLLNEAAQPIQEMIEAVDHGAIIRVARVRLRRDVISEYTEIAPQEVQKVIQRLSSDESPRELILSGDFSPRELERVVLDLILRGAVEQVEAPMSGKLKQVDTTGDEERWAVISGELTAPLTTATRDEERVSIPTILPPALQQEEPPPKLASRGGRSRVIPYLAIVAIAAFALWQLYDYETPSTSPSVVAPNAPSELAPIRTDAGPRFEQERGGGLTSPDAAVPSEDQVDGGGAEVGDGEDGTFHPS